MPRRWRCSSRSICRITLIASLLLLQPVKGAVVGVQWALRMHGFDENAVDGIPPV